jgi:hypothetical protein
MEFFPFLFACYKYIHIFAALNNYILYEMLNNNNYITLNKFPLKSPQTTEDLFIYFPFPYNIISINITKYTLSVF